MTALGRLTDENWHPPEFLLLTRSGPWAKSLIQDSKKEAKLVKEDNHRMGTRWVADVLRFDV